MNTQTLTHGGEAGHAASGLSGNMVSEQRPAVPEDKMLTMKYKRVSLQLSLLFSFLRITHLLHSMEQDQK